MGHRDVRDGLIVDNSCWLGQCHESGNAEWTSVRRCIHAKTIKIILFNSDRTTDVRFGLRGQPFASNLGCSKRTGLGLLVFLLATKRTRAQKHPPQWQLRSEMLSSCVLQCRACAATRLLA